MELEEAKEILNNILKGYHYIGGRVNKEKLALKVVLQALENSVSKDIIREKINERQFELQQEYKDFKDDIRLNTLQELYYYKSKEDI